MLSRVRWVECHRLGNQDLQLVDNAVDGRHAPAVEEVGAGALGHQAAAPARVLGAFAAQLRKFSGCFKLIVL